MILSDDVATDMFHLICGKELGRGCYRTVFEHVLDQNYVVKMDSGANFSNVHEYQMWVEFQNDPIGKWLAPVEWLSPRGLWLIQARTTPIPTKKLPKKIPAIFADTKLDNWGMYKGRPVCHDYGNHRLYQVAKKPGAVLRAVSAW